MLNWKGRNMISTLIFSMLFAFVMSVIVAGVYYIIHKDEVASDMILTLLLLPIIICTIIYTIGNNVAGAFSLAGIFTIVRFRSTQSSPKDITYILLAVAAGLTSATSFYVEGIILILFSSVVIFIYEKLSNKGKVQILKVLIPEDLMNDDAISKILDKYSSYHTLEQVNTKDLGSLFELVYKVQIIKDINYKEMIDEIRVINGNLTIKLTK